VRLLVELGLLQSRHLRLGQHQAFLRALGLQRLQALLHGLQIVPGLVPSVGSVVDSYDNALAETINGLTTKPR
jgi:hypothetical protein